MAFPTVMNSSSLKKTYAPFVVLGYQSNIPLPLLAAPEDIVNSFLSENRVYDYDDNG